MRVFFEAEALIEYREAAQYSQRFFGLGEEFVNAVEAAIATICRDPQRFQAIAPDVRIFRMKRFPYSVLFVHSAENSTIVIYAIAHHSRRPGYWRTRLDQ